MRTNMKELAARVGLDSKVWRYVTVCMTKCSDGVTRNVQTWQHRKTKEFKSIRLCKEIIKS